MKKSSKHWKGREILLLTASIGISAVYYRIHGTGSAFIIGSLVFIGGYYCKKITS